MTVSIVYTLMRMYSYLPEVLWIFGEKSLIIKKFLNSLLVDVFSFQMLSVNKFYGTLLCNDKTAFICIQTKIGLKYSVYNGCDFLE